MPTVCSVKRNLTNPTQMPRKKWIEDNPNVPRDKQVQPCHFCRKPVDLRTSDWDENVKEPAHRVCRNQPPAKYEWVDRMQTNDIHQVRTLMRSSTGFPLELMEKIVGWCRRQETEAKRPARKLHAMRLLSWIDRSVFVLDRKTSTLRCESPAQY